MSIARCANCGKYVHENTTLEYNDRFYCGSRCKGQQERRDDENLRCPQPRATSVSYTEH